MSTLLKFERIKKTPQKVKDIVAGFIGRNEVNSPYQMPESIYFIIILFYWISLESKILTDEECNTLLDMIEKNNKFKHFGPFQLISFKLIFKSYQPDAREIKFKSNCHHKKNLLCIIHTERNNVFGGFTATGWYGASYNHKREIKDNKSFLFSIRSSLAFPSTLYDVQKPERALAIWDGQYCCFGDDLLLYIYHDQTLKIDQVAIYSEASYKSFDNKVFRGDGDDSDIVKGIEVFQLQN